MIGYPSIWLKWALTDHWQVLVLREIIEVKNLFRYWRMLDWLRLQIKRSLAPFVFDKRIATALRLRRLAVLVTVTTANRGIGGISHPFIRSHFNI